MKNEDDSGWILLHRKIQEHWIYPQNRKFTPLEAWIDLLICANHAEKQVNIRNEIMICKRGESLRSLETLSQRWNWNKSATRRFLKMLQKSEMIVTEALPKTTRITICNYDRYQTKRNGDETGMKHRRNGGETGVYPNKELNELKESINSVLDLYNSTSFQKVKKLTPAREGHISARIKEYSLPGVLEVIRKADQSNYLHGSNGKWIADFDWIINPDHFIKIAEGKYDNSKINGSCQNSQTNIVTTAKANLIGSK